MQYFNFSRLINKYKSNFVTLTFAEGYYNDCGDFVKGDSKEISLQGAIINYKESTVRRSEGKLTTQDKRLFLLEPLDEALKNAKVICDDKVFSIEDCGENAKFTGVYAYTLRYCSAFSEFDYSYNILGTLTYMKTQTKTYKKLEVGND